MGEPWGSIEPKKHEKRTHAICGLTYYKIIVYAVISLGWVGNGMSLLIPEILVVVPIFRCAAIF
jgi:hypothetical protein